MTLTYSLRLLCLCLEVFFLVNLVASIAVVAGSHLTNRLVDSMRSLHAARLLFVLRLFPFVLSLAVVLLICIPNYVRAEENAGVERVGWLCIALATLGLASCLASLVQGTVALAQSHLFARHFHGVPSKAVTVAPALPLFVTSIENHGAPLFMLTGILSPKLIVSQQLFNSMTMKQFDAAVAHECAHLNSRDNLKRLLILFTPNAIPFVALLGALEQHWEHCAELAADDVATQGKLDRSLALAEALIQVARLRIKQERLDSHILLASSLSSPNRELAMRVERLMTVSELQIVRAETHSHRNLIFISVGVALCVTLFAAMPSLYPLLESLLH